MEASKAQTVHKLDYFYVQIPNTAGQAAWILAAFPPRIKGDDRLHEREKKCPLIIHAEENALANARFVTGSFLISRSEE